MDINDAIDLIEKSFLLTESMILLEHGQYIKDAWDEIKSSATKFKFVINIDNDTKYSTVCDTKQHIPDKPCVPYTNVPIAGEIS